MKSMNLNNGNSRQPQQQSIEVDPTDLTFAECECGNDTFKSANRLGKLSKVHPKNNLGKTGIVPVPVNICTECGKVLDMSTLAE